MTNGPIHATGSLIGLPPSSSTSSAGERLSWTSAARTVIESPGPKTASCPVATAIFSTPTVPAPAST